MRAGRTPLAPAADLSDGLFRLLVEPAQARAAPRRGTRRETVDPSRLRPACHGEAESRKGATASGRRDLGRRRSVENLMRAEVRVVDEAHLDLLHEIFRHQRPLQTQAERVFYVPQPRQFPLPPYTPCGSAPPSVPTASSPRGPASERSDRFPRTRPAPSS